MTQPHITTIEFDELPIFTDNGFHVGLVNGCVSLNFYEDGEWSISEICLDAWNPSTRESKPVAICKLDHPQLYAMLYDALENGWKDHIESHIERELEDMSVREVA
jgi:hypothetical protein